MSSMSTQIDDDGNVDRVRVQFDTPETLDERLQEFSDHNKISKSGAIRMILNQNLPQKGEIR